MKISHRGLDLILEFENKLTKLPDGRYAAYICPAGKATIYAGCTEGVHMGMIVTEAEGESMFAKEIGKFERAVTLACTREPNQHQFDAFVSLSYNIGAEGLRQSSALRLFNAGKDEKAAEAFCLWNKARKGGSGPKVEMRGLTRRRKAEAALFLRPADDAAAEETGAPDMPQSVEPPKTPLFTPTNVGGGIGGGLGLSFLSDPVGMSSTAVSLKSNAGQLLSGVSIGTWSVPIILGAGLVAFLVWINRRSA